MSERKNGRTQERHNSTAEQRNGRLIAERRTGRTAECKNEEWQNGRTAEHSS
jgi:hypothetical protein